MKTYAQVVALTAMLVVCACVHAGNVMSASEVHSLVAGRTLEGVRKEVEETALDPASVDLPERRVFLYFSMEGGVVGRIGNNDKSGQWSVSNAGELCLQWEGDAPRCAPLLREGNTYMLTAPDQSGSARIIYTFSGYADGNVYGLK